MGKGIQNNTHLFASRDVDGMLSMAAMRKKLSFSRNNHLIPSNTLPSTLGKLVAESEGYVMMAGFQLSDKDYLRLCAKINAHPEIQFRFYSEWTYPGNIGPNHVPPNLELILTQDTSTTELLHAMSFDGLNPLIPAIASRIRGYENTPLIRKIREMEQEGAYENDELEKSTVVMKFATLLSPYGRRFQKQLVEKLIHDMHPLHYPELVEKSTKAQRKFKRLLTQGEVDKQQYFIYVSISGSSKQYGPLATDYLVSMPTNPDVALVSFQIKDQTYIFAKSSDPHLDMGYLFANVTEHMEGKGGGTPTRASAKIPNGSVQDFLASLDHKLAETYSPL